MNRRPGECDEPGLDGVPIDDLFGQFPEGQYRFVGKSPDGEKLEGTATLSHLIPDGPSIVSPGTLDPAHAVIAWNPVTTPAGIDVVGYEVVIEKDDFHVFDVKVPGTTTSVTVPPEFLQPATEYLFEVLAIDTRGAVTGASRSSGGTRGRGMSGGERGAAARIRFLSRSVILG